MRKRQKFVLTSVLLSVGVLAVQYAPLEWRYWLVFGLAAVSWALSAWSLREGLTGVEWLVVTMPPVLFTGAVGLFYILLPQAWWAKLLVVFLFGVGEYALLLTANIFSVAAIRTIALLRAAHAVGFVMTLLTGFFMYDTILSFRLDFWWQGLLVGMATFLLLVPALWSVDLREKISADTWWFSLGLGESVGGLAVAVAFWPVTLAVASLFLTTALYVFLGISQHHFSQRLFFRTVMEYVVVGVVVLVTMLVTSAWGV
ncbi:hypothetical protein A2634_01605 [Candidatus Amesbacteria bacterium RIFCSPHIGHO2_01_FULL_48_32]|uniref:Uncharacterized protein n=1 Tax=Candidatus Amesbacteria bacterium RIFCSPLOWO2_01_FULL_48_25 TaxID=1797259 RepID=A0A1F4ZDD4_9BACT|nr:MAG: hypothetical protein A2634_01605 [Candidatus Amesbacteria bacterium RIFCSPHIGHO2_01_FULL_48_32]OGD03737.1 MAG: hypothetical protein A2989_03590 [Candidatus Amesbacteria bacterium RIFCSPLOWO2_01_FULL_48_25]HJZ05914.1 hypothetical protein [Patescibacteria group bacterium]